MIYHMRDMKNLRQQRGSLTNWLLAALLILVMSFLYGFVEGSVQSIPAPSAPQVRFV